MTAVPDFRRYIDIVEQQIATGEQQHRFPPPKDSGYQSAVDIAVEMFNEIKKHTNPGEWDRIIWELSMNYNISEIDIRDNVSDLEEAKEPAPQRAKSKVTKKPAAQYAEPEIDTKGGLDDLGVATSKGEVEPHVEPEKELPGRTRSRAQSRITAVELPHGSADVMRDFMARTADVTDPVDVPDYHDDVAGAVPDPEPKTPGKEVYKPGTTVANLNTALVDIANDIDLNWHEIKNLPGYAIEQIRGAFRPLFNEFMDAELENIKVVTTLDGSIDKDDLRSFMGYLGTHGTKYDDFDLEAFGIDPEMYKVEKAYLYYLNGFNFLLMQEKLMGMRNWYIYAGPAKYKPELEGDGDKPKQLTGT